MAFSQLFSTSVCCSSIHLNAPIKPADLHQKTLQNDVKPAQELIFKVLNWWELRSHKTQPTARNKAEESSEERLISFDLFAVHVAALSLSKNEKLRSDRSPTKLCSRLSKSLMSAGAVAIISVMLKLIPRAQKEQLSTAVCRSNHKVFPVAEAAETNPQPAGVCLLSVWRQTEPVRTKSNWTEGRFQNSRADLGILPNNKVSAEVFQRLLMFVCGSVC